MKIVFFGTPSFAATILEYLLQQQASIIAIVTKPDRRKGRNLQISPGAVKLVAEKHNIPLYQPEKARDPQFVALLRELHADLFVVAAYSEIFNSALLTLPPLGCINVHASILPKFRGAAPIERCIMAGETESGVTIMAMAKELDAGDMFAIAKTPIPESMTSGELYEALAQLGGPALWQVIQQIDQGSAKKTPQDHSQATFAPKVNLEDGEIDWNNPVETIYNQFRGVTPKPGAWCWVKVNNSLKRLLLKKVSPNAEKRGRPGEILVEQEKLFVGCGRGVLSLEMVQLEGKKCLSVADFLRGVPLSALTFELKK